MLVKVDDRWWEGVHQVIETFHEYEGRRGDWKEVGRGFEVLSKRYVGETWEEEHEGRGGDKVGFKG